MERLLSSNAAFGAAWLNPPYDHDKTAKANKLSDCYVRPIAWRGSELMGVTTQVNGVNAARIHLSVAAWDWGSYFPMEERLKGLRLTLAKYRRMSRFCHPVNF